MTYDELDNHLSGLCNHDLSDRPDLDYNATKRLLNFQPMSFTVEKRVISDLRVELFAFT